MARRDQRYPANRFRIEYASPFLERPTPEWIEQTRKNFNWDKFDNKSLNAPDPSLLPIPSDKLLDKKNKKHEYTIVGKKRTWKISSRARGNKRKKYTKKNLKKKFKKR
jgi:hypothetical protein